MIKNRISNLSKKEGGDIFDKKIGKIITKFWAAGTATCSDFDNYIQKLKEKRDIKVAMSNTFGFGGHNACVAFRKID